MSLKITKALELYTKFLDLSQEWLVLSWSKKSYDKKIAFLMYLKYKDQRQKMAKRLSELSKQYA